MAREAAPSLDALLADACVVVSCLIQHGVEPSDLATSMGRLGNAEPASIIGAVVDLVAAANAAQPTVRRRRPAHDPRTYAAARSRHHCRAGRGLRRRGGSMSAVAARWSITLGHTVTPAQVVLCMIDLKLAACA